MKKILLPLIIFSLLFVNSAYSQGYSVTHFNESRGFTGSTVYKVSQDSLGYIWICTNAGLMRYDGINFKTFAVEDGVIDLDVFSMSIDAQNHIFLHNFSNKGNYYFEGKFYNVQNNPKLLGVQFQNIPVATFHKKENAFLLSALNENHFFYIKTENGLIIKKEKVFLGKNKTIQSILSMNDLYYVFYLNGARGNSLYNVYRDTTLLNTGRFIPSGGIVSSGSNIITYKLDGDSSKICFFEEKPSHDLHLYREQKINSSIKNLFFKKGELWATVNKGGIIKIDDNGIVDYLMPDISINNIYIDNESDLWIATEGDGLYYFRKNNIRNYGIEELGVSKCVMSLCSGKNGKIYLGFNKMAVAEIDHDSVSRVINLNPENLLESRRVKKLVYFNDSILCGGDGKLFKLSANFNEQTNVKIIPIAFITVKEFFFLKKENTLLAVQEV